MRLTTRRIASTGAAMAIAVTGLLLGAGASPAFAATSCYASSCSGLNPAATTCADDARTIQTSSFGVELRYSPSCRAAWARRASGMNGVGDTISIWNDSSSAPDFNALHVPANGSGPYYTRMVNDADIKSRACDVVDSYGGVSCTDWF
ncbi:DUF2690 domain-containing protein [Kitasatospora sp. NPDC127059]|uniref:DUF2690 domain-containing protein n=1 Tax=unclassified Kitasatospora TaxID=2633591 RepID=UPI00364EC133